jgi:hypothetical protein
LLGGSGDEGMWGAPPVLGPDGELFVVVNTDSDDWPEGVSARAGGFDVVLLEFAV